MITLTVPGVGSVDLREMYDGYEKGIDISRGPWVRKKYLCDTWAHTDKVCNTLMGSGRTIAPQACPESPNLYCVDARVAGEAEDDARDGGRPAFELPVIECTFGVLAWEALVADDPEGLQSFPNDASPGTPYLFMEQSIDFDTETIKLPGRAYKFETAGTPFDGQAACTIAVAQFVLIRRWQDTLPYVNVTAYLNKLNDSTFLGQDRGTIKFRKARTRRQFVSDGTKTQEVEYVFQWREFDHNKAHRPDVRFFETIVDSTGATPYTYSNLATLLS